MKLKRNRRHSVILTTILALLMLAGCSSAKDDEVIKEEPTTVVQVEVDEVEEKVETVVEEVAESTVEEVETETETETVEEVQMVDWETWATNTDTADVCLAISNETTGTQTFLEDGINVVKYDIQEGDRFSIAHRDIIKAVFINNQEILPVETASGAYYEIIPEGERAHVTVLIAEEGKTEYCLTYKLYNR